MNQQKKMAAEPNVRELEPAAPQAKKITGKTRRWKILAGGFARCPFGRVYACQLFGRGSRQLAENDKLHQQQEIRQHQQCTDGFWNKRKLSLNGKKEQLLRESAVLSQQQQQKKAEANTLLDKSDEILKEVQQSSGVKKNME